jgi:hypothetical protein
MRRAAVVLLFTPLALATACGGSSAPRSAASPTPSPSITVPGLISSTGAVPASYLKDVDFACAMQLSFVRQGGPVPALGSDPSRLTAKQLQSAAAYLAHRAGVLHRMALGLTHTAPPASGRDAWAVYVVAAGQYAAGTQSEATAANAGDVPAFLAAARRLLPLQRKVAESGLAVGFGAGTACARLF